MSEDLTALAADAYVYGFPLVTNLREVKKFTRDGLGSLPPAPFNSFSHATALAGPAERFVSVNNDTVYSIAQADLSGGPLLLSVPDTAGRYYVLQFVDAWTNNFAYVGRRATGTRAGSFLLTPPHWKGSVPAGTSVIEFPTTVGSIVGRWACQGQDELPAVRALQAGQADHGGVAASGRHLPGGQWLDARLPRIRLQPRPSRPWHDRRPGVEDARPHGQLPGAGAGHAGRPVGQPRVRGRLRDDLHRRRRVADDRHAARAARGHERLAAGPAAPFRPISRIYQPRAAVLDGSYRLPPITKAIA